MRFWITYGVAFFGMGAIGMYESISQQDSIFHFVMKLFTYGGLTSIMIGENKK